MLSSLDALQGVQGDIRRSCQFREAICSVPSPVAYPGMDRLSGTLFAARTNLLCVPSDIIAISKVMAFEADGEQVPVVMRSAKEPWCDVVDLQVAVGLAQFPRLATITAAVPVTRQYPGAHPVPLCRRWYRDDGDRPLPGILDYSIGSVRHPHTPCHTQRKYAAASGADGWQSSARSPGAPQSSFPYVQYSRYFTYIQAQNT